MARPLGASLDDDLSLLNVKMKQAKFEYEQYFLGHRPREPSMVRGEVQKIVAYWSNQPIRNTAQRFRFNTLCSRFFSFRRRWDETCRKIDDGTFEPHLRKLERNQRAAAPERQTPPPVSHPDVVDAYLEAREACGQSVAGLERSQVEKLLDKQRRAICEKYGCDEVRFRVVVESGRPKLKASPVRKKG